MSPTTRSASPPNSASRTRTSRWRPRDLARLPLPSVNAWRDRLLSAIAHGHGELDWAVVAREQAEAGGLD